MAINTRDARSWLAAPNNGQTLLYPPRHNKNPNTRVITVAKYLFAKSFRIPVRSEPSAASPKKSSWKDIRPIRATESRDVSARAETHMVMKQVATCSRDAKQSQETGYVGRKDLERSSGRHLAAYSSSSYDN